jgi:multiple sugar transport system permease protein
LQTIPKELYEAARIDGASSSQTFIRITIPLLIPIGLVILLLTFIHHLHAFDLVQTMTAGGPNSSSDIIDTYVYRYTFNPEHEFPRYGYASAVGILFGVTVMILTSIQAYAVRRTHQFGKRS